jgi:teichuronic acid biosynthesis glycosyltransferase TuaC
VDRQPPAMHVSEKRQESLASSKPRGDGIVNQSRHGNDLHVLTITPFYPTASDGAMGCFVAEPLTSLMERGVRSTVFAVEPLYRSRPEKTLGAPDAEWFRYPSLPSGFGLSSAGTGLYLRLRGAVKALHARSPVDLIHAHGALPCGHAALLLTRHLQIPYVVSVHGLDAFATMQVVGNAGTRCARISRQVYAEARHVVGVSEHVCEEIRRGMDRSAVVSVVYNGADPNVFQPAQDRAQPTLLTVGNLIAVKGHTLVAEALGTLLPEFPNLVWEVIGDGPELDRVRSVAGKLGVLSAVRFRGRLDRSAVAEAYGRCTVFVLPSRYEGLGCVYLEAMASGKVAIGCRGQGIEEVIRHGENGWLISPGGKDELVDGVRRLLRDADLRTQIGKAARSTILESFTLRHQAERLLHVYRESVA